MGIDLPLIWAVVIIFGIMMYVIMDGFDLGIGILFPFIRGERDRDVMMNTVAPVWDGNETWLVLGGAGLFGAFPLAYSVVLSALYLPLILMLIGLIFRGVAFEFRFKAKAEKRHLWDKAFIGGSLTATFFQGVALGAFIDGFQVVNRQFAGGSLDWLTPFTMFCGLALIAAYALLGCTWLIMKTEGKLQEQMHDLARPLAFVVLAVIGIVSLWTPLAHADIAARWFTLPNLFWFLPVPILVLVTMYGLFRAVARNAHYTPFILTLVLIFLGYSGLGISLWPNIVPPSISIWDAASPPQSQGFMLVGTLFIIPLILVYTFWSYYVFRGKVTHDDGYH
ncbi:MULTISPECIES: cytochrome d ubiquinol oxidase subunit II [unclassified Pseudomonas]|uniref:cytochrome d ubiquinol oxidase subunit II n=1 Tax=unclassified Pseudomonas TaxID=196821 RepID=UPI00119BC9E0|nr:MULTISPECIES: cytochrome d ubiquinol oxidase subunit II [unclassified Pseudomonas]TWC10951.1 cytochrome bd-I ubiquinol oxidase subunit 2 apoprotein [Pseudomonas sp. SJZ075]TWC12408.1 cytochrome bd-I ubiquinol oxidase subunit 2 apoprotein [Pseudomonas sp. SJZ074]TWC27147.1 cytochrome bd-I ubiquinol oxidase subunit 2 apoprotein [Pseudomonas sp. SJZ078]TWC30881.1 cytochrome bd-I ubiquinol oxidase subunit 2 apoprotein [Pseudomonas sp. SJZ085]TWC47134.1 cytochrome bd-I ubiquinol oxidase subunit 